MYLDFVYQRRFGGPDAYLFFFSALTLFHCEARTEAGAGFSIMRHLLAFLLFVCHHVYAVTVTVQGPVFHGQNLTSTWTRTADEDEIFIGVIAPQGQENVQGLPWFRTSSQGNLQWTSSFQIGAELKNGNYHIIAANNSNGNPLYSGNVFTVEDQAPSGTTSSEQTTPSSQGSSSTSTPTGSSTTKSSPTSSGTSSSTSPSNSTQPTQTTQTTPTGLGAEISTQQQSQSSTSSSPPVQSSGSPSQIQEGSDSQQSKPPIPIIVGSVLGVLALIVLLLLALFCRRRRRRLRLQNGQKAELLDERPIPSFRAAFSGLEGSSLEGSTAAFMNEKGREDSTNLSTTGESSSASGSAFAPAALPVAADDTDSRTPEPAPTPEVALPTRALPLPPSSPRPPSTAPTTFTTYTAYSGLPSFSSNLDNQALLSQFQRALAEITRLDSHGATEDLELPTFSEDMPPQDMAAQLHRAMDEILRLRAQLQVRQDEPPAYETG